MGKLKSIDDLKREQNQLRKVLAESYDVPSADKTLKEEQDQLVNDTRTTVQNQPYPKLKKCSLKKKNGKSKEISVPAVVKPRNKYNRADLVQELNRLKRKEFGEKFCPITRGQIYLYCNPKNTEVKRYRTFSIKKKNGKPREISAPYRTLHSIQVALNAYFKEIYTPSESAMGFAPGRSVAENARVHVGHNYVLNIDLKNFFPSISEGRVIARLQMKPFYFNKEIAQVIGGLCALRVEEDGKEKFVLPQGAPTSPLLTNAICDSLDKKLRHLAHEYGLHYSRYADDMTFSSMRNMFKEGGEFMPKVRKIITEEGFVINEDKTRIQKRGGRQEVTGLTVNTKVNVAKHYIHDIRCILYIWEKYGYAEAYARFYPKYKREKGYIKQGEPVLENVINGKLNYLKMVKGKNDLVLNRLLTRYNALSPCIYSDKETDKGYKYVFVQSYTIEKFEEIFNTKITLKSSEKDAIIGICELFGREKYISVSKKTQEWLRKVYDADSNSVRNIKFYQDVFPLCYITLCRQHAKNFWFITQNEPQKTTVTRLIYKNIPLDELLKVWDKDGLEAVADLFFQCCTNEKANRRLDTKEESSKTKGKKEKITSSLANVTLFNDLDTFNVDAFDIEDELNI